MAIPKTIAKIQSLASTFPDFFLRNGEIIGPFKSP
jgi:hypothetical protein